MPGSVTLLAHQGGWDEMLMVLAPILAFYLILRAAKHRADRLEHTPPDASDAGDHGADG